MVMADGGGEIWSTHARAHTQHRAGRHKDHSATQHRKIHQPVCRRDLLKDRLVVPSSSTASTWWRNRLRRGAVLAIRMGVSDDVLAAVSTQVRCGNCSEGRQFVAVKAAERWTNGWTLVMHPVGRTQIPKTTTAAQSPEAYL